MNNQSINFTLFFRKAKIVYIKLYRELKKLWCNRLFLNCLKFIFSLALISVYLYAAKILYTNETFGKEFNLYLVICFAIALSSLTLWIFNPFSITDRFFGKSKSPAPYIIFKYIGTLCGAVFIIGNFIIFNDNNRLQLNQLSSQMEEIELQRAHYENLNAQEERQKYYNAVDNLMSSDRGRILSGFYEVLNYYDRGSQLSNYKDSIPVPEFYNSVPQSIARFIELHNPRQIENNDDINKARKNNHKSFVENAISKLFESSSNYYDGDISLRDLHFNGIDIKDVFITSQLDLDNTIFSNLKFTNATFDECYWYNVEFHNVTFQECRFLIMKFNEPEEDSPYHSVFINCKFLDCIFEPAVAFRDVDFNNVHFIGAKPTFNEEEWRNSTEMNYVNFFRCNLQNVTFENVDIYNLDIDTTCVVDSSSIRFIKTNLDSIPVNQILKNSLELTEAALTIQGEDIEDLANSNAKDEIDKKPQIVENQPFPIGYSIFIVVMILILVFIFYFEMREE